MPLSEEEGLRYDKLKLKLQQQAQEATQLKNIFLTCFGGILSSGEKDYESAVVEAFKAGKVFDKSLKKYGAEVDEKNEEFKEYNVLNKRMFELPQK